MNTSKTFLNDFFKSQQLWLHLRQGFRILMIIALAVLLWSEANAQTGDPDIDVRGRGISITNGDDTPSSSDDTDFGSAAIGEQNGNMWKIYNIGTATLNLTGTPRIQISGPHAADFRVVELYYSTLAPGAYSEVDMAFKPTGAGLRTATITIPNNDPDENPFVFAIQGTGIGIPDIDVRGGSPRVSIANGDDTPWHGDGTYFSVTVGESYAQTFFIYNTGDDNLNLTGTPAVQFTGPHAADFSLSTIYYTTIAPGGNTEFDIVFTPSAPGERTATVVIPNNDPDENPYTFAVQGKGLAPEIKVAHSDHPFVIIADGDMTPSEDDGTDIGSANVGDIKTVEFRISNDGGDNVMLYLTARPEVQISGVNASDFTFTDITRNEIGVGMHSNFHIQFNPSAPGLRSAIISIPNNDPDENPYDFAIQGTGLPVGAPEIEVQGGSPLASISDAATTPEIANGTDWGEINVGSGAVEHTFSIQNTGAVDLNLTGSSSRVVVTGEGFSLVTDATTPVAANGSATFTICFIPSAPGVKTGTVSIANDDADENPYNFVISATVVDQVAPVIVPVPGFTTIWLATSCYQTYRVTQCVASVSDNCASLTLDDVVISRVTSDEEEDAPGIGDGFTKKDIVIAADGKSVKLRRERNIFRNGRVYTIHFSVNDGNGNTGTATYLVTVPICPYTRPAVDDGPLYIVNGALSKSLDLEDEQLEGEFVETIPPEAFVLEQNYPNPFNPQTLITYALPFEATVSLKVLDTLGREVLELVQASQPAGVYQAPFNGQGLASGVYYYTLKVVDHSGKTFSQTKRMLLTK